VEACRRSRVVGVVSGPSDPRYRAGGLWAVWSRESRSGHDGGIVRGVAPCADHVRRALHAALTGEVAGIWPPGHPAHLGHVGDVIRSVICDARGEAVARAVRPGLLDGMRELEERVEALYDEIIPEGEADYEEDAIEGIVRLSDAVIGPKPEGRKPSLYLVNGRHLVVGRGRADVRRVMMGFGLSKPRIQGISPGEKFEDGRTAEDIIKTAVRVPALIGRMEE